MGLDISYYTKVKKAGPEVEVDEDGYPVDTALVLVKVYVNDAFVEQADDIENAGLYGYETSGGFRAGSYSGYGEWREWLAKLAGYPATAYESHGGAMEMRHAAACWNGAKGPFSELIDFSDAEGVIGPVTARKLLRDFISFDERAKNIGSDGWHYRKYLDWKAAFEAASDDGMVCFH